MFAVNNCEQVKKDSCSQLLTANGCLTSFDLPNYSVVICCFGIRDITISNYKSMYVSDEMIHRQIAKTPNIRKSKLGGYDKVNKHIYTTKYIQMFEIYN